VLALGRAQASLALLSLLQRCSVAVQICLRNQGRDNPEFSIINSKEPRNQGKNIPEFPDSLDQNNSLDNKKPLPSDYHGIPFTDIIAKYWEVNNRGFEPTQGDRDTLTYQLACDLRHICGRNFE
jgi:hypothetical protein